jgi:hypothetical protein
MLKNSIITATGIESKNGIKEKKEKNTVFCLKNEIRKRKAAWIVDSRVFVVAL